MSFSQKIIVIVLMAAMAIGIIYVGQTNNLEAEENKKMSYYQTETLHLWYTEDSFTEFFTNAAVEFHEKYPEIRVIPSLVSSAEYLEKINEASLNNEEFPDLFMLTNDSLEKAYLSGLASQVRDNQHVLNINHFGKGALYAVNYSGLNVAYPLNFDTTLLLYNKTYLEDWVEKVNAGESAVAENGDVLDENGNVVSQTEEEVSSTEVYLDNYIPQTFDDIISFADEYKAADGVESILQWDVTDIFYNYLFSGAYMIVGGDAGDDIDNIDIYNDNTLACIQAYQNLNQVFSIDAETSNYEKVLEDFLQGKTVFTLVTTDALATVDKAVEDRLEEIRILSEANALDSEGTETDTSDIPRAYEFGYAMVPNVSDTLSSRSLSVTNTVVINGYSEKKDAANKFAAFVTTEYSDQIYSRTGKLAASTDAGYTDEALLAFQAEYAKSIPLPKMVELSNLWIQLEIAFTDIWSGADVSERLSTFAQQINSQILNQ